jgi:hypothetical protein
MYLDPSFGGMLIQIIIAIVAGGGAILFGMRRKIKSFFSKNKEDAANDVNFQAADHEELVDMMDDDHGATK